MRPVLAVLLISFTLPLFAATQPNPSAKQRELIDELLLVTNMTKMETDIIDAMLAQFQTQILDAIPANQPERLADAKQDFERYRELVRASDIHKDTRELYYTLYAKYFTESDLADLIVFYKSPVGMKTLSVMPQMMGEAMQQTSTMLGKKMEDLYAQVQREHDLRKPWEKTISRMRSIGNALSGYAADNEDAYPDGDFTAMIAAVEDYGSVLETSDVWGNDFAYVVSPDHKHFRIVSSGADANFEWDSRRIVAKNPAVRYTDRLEDDIVLADGELIQAPKASKPKE